MSVPNMHGGLFHSYVHLEKGSILNNAQISMTHIIEGDTKSERASINLRNQNDNLQINGCILYIDEPWKDIQERSHNLLERDNSYSTKRNISKKIYPRFI